MALAFITTTQSMKQTRRGVKTTIEIPEPVWRAVRQRALDEDRNMRSVMIEALEQFLTRQRRTRRPWSIEPNVPRESFAGRRAL